MRRFINWIRGVFNKTMDRVEDPEMMLDQARRDMQATLTANRERAIQAITQRNQLDKMLQDNRSKSLAYENQTITALKQGDRELAVKLMREKTNLDSVVAGLQASHDQATATVESVKIAIQRQQEEVQKKTAEALALKAQWKNAQIQNSIAKALDGLTFENQFEGFGAAKERISQAQSEASARQEMHHESLQGKLMAMQDKTMDYEAEAELQKLEQRLGMKTPEATTEVAGAAQQTVSVGGTDGAPADPETAAKVNSEADRQLEELEKRIKGS